MNIALVGNQNSGKTTLFNKLTGENCKVGNWPGVTVDFKENKIINTDINIVDLPGIYSLMPYSSEEEITTQFLQNKNIDLLVDVIDVNSLERGLYLFSQLVDLKFNVIIVLTKIEKFKKNGKKINLEKLSSILNVEVYDFNDNNLLDKIERDVKNKKTQKYKFNYEKYIDNNEKYINIKQNNIKTYGEIAKKRYEFCEKVCNQSVELLKEQNKKTFDFDKVFLNKWFAIPIFVFIMSYVYIFSVGVVGKFFSGQIFYVLNYFKLNLDKLLHICGTSNWSSSLLINGIFTGAVTVLSFLPQLVALNFCMALLEDSGYMARIAVIFDSIFSKIGLNGSSIIPFILGSSCSVPAINSCRTIENKSARERTIILTPFIPCSAKLSIIALFAGYFFKNHSGLVSVSFYFLSILIIILTSLILNKISNKNKYERTFIIELPEYKIPSLKVVFREVFEKTFEFIKKVGSEIILCSIILWFMSSFNLRLRYTESIDDSLVASIGKMFSWFFYPILNEYNWQATVSAIQGLIAKEQVISSMSMLANLSGEISVNQIFSSSVFSNFTNATAYAFVVFNLFSAPCISSILAMRAELRSNKKTFLMVIVQILLAWILAIIFKYLISIIW